MGMSPPARLLLGAGALALLLDIVNHAGAARLDPALERASVLAGALAIGLMLVGLLWTRIEPRPPERADLQGEEGFERIPDLPVSLERELGWGSLMLLSATPAAVVLLHWNGWTVLRRGLLQAGGAPFRPGPICAKALERGRPISLVDLRLYPGREEFHDLLPGLPSVLVQPVGERGLLLLGGWSPRCFSASDLRWVEGWSRRLTAEWAPELDAVAAATTDGSASGPGNG
jgi:hypothetical protein